MKRIVAIALLVEVVTLGSASPRAQGYGGAPSPPAYTPAPAPTPSYDPPPYNPYPPQTCQPYVTTSTIHTPQYFTETKSVISYKTQYQTQYETHYQTQYKTEYVNKIQDVPVYVTTTQTHYATSTVKVPIYTTKTVPTYVTKTIKEPHYVTPSCAPTGGYGGSSGGAPVGIIDLRKGTTTPKPDTQDGAWEWSA